MKAIIKNGVANSGDNLKESGSLERQATYNLIKFNQ